MYSKRHVSSRVSSEDAPQDFEEVRFPDRPKRKNRVKEKREWRRNHGSEHKRQERKLGTQPQPFYWIREVPLKRPFCYQGQSFFCPQQAALVYALKDLFRSYHPQQGKNFFRAMSDPARKTVIWFDAVLTQGEHSIFLMHFRPKGETLKVSKGLTWDDHSHQKKRHLGTLKRDARNFERVERNNKLKQSEGPFLATRKQREEHMQKERENEKLYFTAAMESRLAEDLKVPCPKVILFADAEEAGRQLQKYFPFLKRRAFEQVYRSWTEHFIRYEKRQPAPAQVPAVVAAGSQQDPSQDDGLAGIIQLYFDEDPKRNELLGSRVA